jgi:hypothetical protein
MEQRKPTQLDLFFDFLPYVLRQRGASAQSILTEIIRENFPYGSEEEFILRCSVAIQRAFDR